MDYRKYHAWWRKYIERDGGYVVEKETDLGVFKVPDDKDPAQYIREEVGYAPAGFTLDYIMERPS